MEGQVHRLKLLKNANLMGGLDLICYGIERWHGLLELSMKDDGESFFRVLDAPVS